MTDLKGDGMTEYNLYCDESCHLETTTATLWY